MDHVADGAVEVVFGIVLAAGHYEARRGRLEFRGGRLVAVRFGRHEQESAEGLTVGFTLLSAPPPPGIEEVLARAVSRVYSRGILDGETDLGEVSVYTDPLA